MVTLTAACTISRNDNLLSVMREMFYEVSATRRITHILAGARAVSGYADVTGQYDRTVEMFKHLPVLIDAKVPTNEMHFIGDGETLGVISHIS